MTIPTSPAESIRQQLGRLDQAQTELDGVPTGDTLTESFREKTQQRLNDRRALLNNELSLQNDLDQLQARLRETPATDKQTVAELKKSIAEKQKAKANLLKSQRSFGGGRRQFGDVCIACMSKEIQRVKDVANYQPISAQQLYDVMHQRNPQFTLADAERHVGPLNDAMREFAINTPQRQAAFLSQVAVETDGLRTFNEYGSNRYFARYNSRRDLGNTEPGDGPRFHGRGAIQTTGRANYRRVGQALGVDFENSPELLAEPEHAYRSAGYYYTEQRNLNRFADEDDILHVSTGVNGRNRNTGLPNHWAERQESYNTARTTLGLPALSPPPRP